MKKNQGWMNNIILLLQKRLKIFMWKKGKSWKEIGSKLTKENITRLGLELVGIICIVVALSGLYGTYKEYKDAKDKYDQVENEFVHKEEIESEEDSITTESESVSESEVTETEKKEIPWYESVSVDLVGLQSKYDEVVGWIYFENNTISYPLMHTTDNNKYLRMAYDGSYSRAGSIFVEATHKSDFSGMHTIIYGHNQKDNNMFGRLLHYQKYTWYYANHQYFQIFSGDKIYRYQIFAYQPVTVDSFIFREVFSSADVLAQRLLENSLRNPGIQVNEDDKIVTLCTCTDDTVDRFIVSAVLVETYDRTEKTLTNH